MTPQGLWRDSLWLQKFSVTNGHHLNYIIRIKELYCTTKQEEGKLQSKFTRWPPSWIWAFQVSGPPQLLRVSLTIVYTCHDHVLESLKMAFFVGILDSKYSKMKFCKPCNCVTHLVVFSLKYFLPGNYHSKLTLSDRIQGAKKVSLIACQLWASCRLHVPAQKPFQLAKKN